MKNFDLNLNLNLNVDVNIDEKRKTKDDKRIMITKDVDLNVDKVLQVLMQENNHSKYNNG